MNTRIAKATKMWQVFLPAFLVAGCARSSPATLEKPAETPPKIPSATSPVAKNEEPPEPASPSKARLEELVLDLCRTPRFAGSAEERAAAERIAANLRAQGYAPSLQSFGMPGKLRSQNVVCTTGPGEKPLLIIGAHYDSKAPSSVGAIDNASGVAALLEVARCIKGQPLGIKVAFVAFGAEERLNPKAGHHFGSRYYVRRLLRHVPKSEILGVINIDMACGEKLYIGSMNPEAGAPILTTAHAEATALGLQFISEKERGNSDHEAFERRGIPAAYFHYWPAKNGAYHNAKDRPELVDYEQVQGVAQMVLNTALSMDRAVKRRDVAALGSDPGKPRR